MWWAAVRLYLLVVYLNPLMPVVANLFWPFLCIDFFVFICFLFLVFFFNFVFYIIISKFWCSGVKPDLSLTNYGKYHTYMTIKVFVVAVMIAAWLNHPKWHITALLSIMKQSVFLTAVCNILVEHVELHYYGKK